MTALTPDQRKKNSEVVKVVSQLTKFIMSQPHTVNFEVNPLGDLVTSIARICWAAELHETVRRAAQASLTTIARYRSDIFGAQADGALEELKRVSALIPSQFEERQKARIKNFLQQTLEKAIREASEEKG